MPEKDKKKDPLVAAVVAWLVPGAGHLYLGRRGKAAVFFVLITGSFVYGLSLGEFKNVYPERYPAGFFGQIFTGIPALAGLALNYAMPGQVDESEKTFDLSFVYTCVAGLLNLLLIIDASYTASGGKHGYESD